ncbi:hypothetical protein LTR99_011068 [Exophiala xenobiotica]|nr:hypothetical protein LTR41_011169 [Exophiala xenobiotica]KAK5215804.1 hypothetical protein LTR72_011160 [Exophiala xenobiotica]KAK5220840.1 hypothetical protein LTR47_011099 [Exophiala xenobiotica]KAK5245649.1 hypothetical protein LTS06_008950 [Exophiala xenobiotica]KAK5263537.1 hypothetical protein LTR96_011069 [Exophiala xenobiotica]
MTSGSRQSHFMDRNHNRVIHTDLSGPIYRTATPKTQYRAFGEVVLHRARKDIYFPFLISEVNCGKQGLDLADRPNAHSMTVALRGVVPVYRKAGRAAEVHRRVLGYSISHDHRSARIYAHYPEIDDLLQRLTAVIDDLADPVEPILDSANFDGFSILSSQDDSSAPESQDEGFRKPRRGGGLNAEFRTMIQSLQRKLGQQRRDSEQQRQDARDRESTLIVQLEQHRKDSEQQRKELVEMLKEQSEQIKGLLRKQ